MQIVLEGNDNLFTQPAHPLDYPVVGITYRWLDRTQYKGAVESNSLQAFPANEVGQALHINLYVGKLGHGCVVWNDDQG